MTSKNWHEGSASVVLLPSGETGAELIKLVSEWTKSWMLKPAFWISEADIVDSSDGPQEFLRQSPEEMVQKE